MQPATLHDTLFFLHRASCGTLLVARVKCRTSFFFLTALDTTPLYAHSPPCESALCAHLLPLDFRMPVRVSVCVYLRAALRLHSTRMWRLVQPRQRPKRTLPSSWATWEHAAEWTWLMCCAQRCLFGLLPLSHGSLLSMLCTYCCWLPGHWSLWVAASYSFPLGGRLLFLLIFILLRPLCLLILKSSLIFLSARND